MKPRQRGLIVPALLVLLLIGGLAMVLGGNTLSDQVAAQRQRTTTAALAQARAALLGYAQSYHLTHPGQSVGYLPCPDIDSAASDGSAAPVCGSQDHFAIGRLPYRTLGLPPLRDGYGECLWYAVSGPFKNNPKAAHLDWDTPGQFDISDGNRTLNPAVYDDQLAAAVIFSPGRPLTGQTRSSSSRRCGGDADATAALQAYLEGATSTPSSAITTLTRGHPADGTNNDSIAWMSADDIFDAKLLVRADFATFLNAMNTNLKTALTNVKTASPAAALPPVASTSVGLIDIGELPAPFSTPPANAAEQAYNDAHALAKSWQGQIRYLRCSDGSACLQWDDGSGIPRQCIAAVAFAGHRLPTQNRSDGIVDTPEFFEGGNISAVSAGTILSGPNVYDGAFPATDVIQCVQ
ncbi:hypothetical protein [Denitromonas sp.]|uniref:hypothetical protein n=1 Tax=Denitromonas sp. TaxID=2734609 RepID=UPI001D831EE5|nr:hypothetical protein [Rhodocyclaceae bacterium]HQU88162.1 hypothetical protein [Denitromonas sp.]